MQYDMCADSTKWLPRSPLATLAHDIPGASRHDENRTERESEPHAAGEGLDGLGHAVGRRPCVDCGRRTGNWCDDCEFTVPFGVPFCNECEMKGLKCHRCRGQPWCTPPIHGVAALKGEIDTRVTLLEQLRRLNLEKEWWEIALGQPGHLPGLDALRDLLGNAQQSRAPQQREELPRDVLRSH